MYKLGTSFRPFLTRFQTRVVMNQRYFSDVKILQDRLSSNENGSITSVQTIYVPADDLSDPAVQMIQHELDSIIVLSRKVAEQGIRPAVDLNQTTSSLLTPDVVGERHYLLSVQVQHCYKSTNRSRVSLLSSAKTSFLRRIVPIMPRQNS